jgi:hypothetical protein
MHVHDFILRKSVSVSTMFIELLAFRDTFLLCFGPPDSEVKPEEQHEAYIFTIF